VVAGAFFIHKLQDQETDSALSVAEPLAYREGQESEADAKIQMAQHLHCFSHNK